MIEVIIFSAFTILFFLIPGWQLIDWTGLKFSQSVFFGLALVLGMLLFTLVTLVIRVMGLPFTILFVYLLPVFFGVWIKRKFLRSKINTLNISKKKLIIVGIIILVSASLVIPQLASGFDEGGLRIAGARDSLWHIAISEELLQHFPPQIPGFPPIILKNYHFFYDLLVAGSAVVSGIQTITLYSHFFSFLSAFVFVLLTYGFFSLWIKNSLRAVLITILTINTGNLSHLLPFISRQYHFFSRSNIFMSDQPFDQGFNPFNLLAYAILISIILLFNYWLKQRQKKVFILLSFCCALLIGFKIYAAIVVFAGLIITLGIEIISAKKFSLQILLPFALALPITVLIKGSGFSILAFNPGWLLTKMIEDQDRLFLPTTALKLQYYQNTGNRLHYWLIISEILLIYLVGNLNIRILAVLGFVNKFRNQLPRLLFILLLALSTIAIALPLLLSQTRAPYDSIQFTTYGLLTLGLLAGIAIDKLYIVITKKRKLAGIGLFLLLFLVAIPANIAVFWSGVIGTKFLIPNAEIKALQFLRAIKENNTVILTDLDDEKMTIMYVPALSSKATYLAGTALAQQVGADTKTRQDPVADFFHYDKETTMNKSTKLNFLKENKINYIYLSKSGLKNRQLMELLNLRAVFKNEEVVVYKTT